MTSLNEIPSVVNAPNGVSGKRRDCHGKNADHTVLDVPVGTIFRNMVS